MSSRPTLPDQADRALQRDEDAQYYREVLHEFIDMSRDLARAVHRQATQDHEQQPAGAAEAEPARAPSSPDPAIALDRLARIVRRTIALARKLSEPDREPPTPQQRGTHQHGSGHRPSPRQQLKPGKPLAKLTDAELHERMAEHGLDYDDERYNELDRKEDLGDDDDEFDDDLIAYACRSLGITSLPDTHPWKRVLDQVAQESAQTSEPDRSPRAAQPTTGQPRVPQSAAHPAPGPTRGHPYPTRPGTGPPRS